MPSWAWLIVDLVIVLVAVAVVVRTGWRFWRRTRAFLSAMSALLDEVPPLPHR
ncbi:MAG TPA: hypothetical protein VIJ71_05630 [Mycobacteriales bacterium]